MRHLEVSAGDGRRFGKRTSDRFGHHDASRFEEDPMRRLRLTVLYGGPSTEREKVRRILDEAEVSLVAEAEARELSSAHGRGSVRAATIGGERVACDFIVLALGRQPSALRRNGQRVSPRLPNVSKPVPSIKNWA